jgi:formate hydrogenlyase subunit 6/NADH:ubiquinone oxidoreductase subunit I
MKLPCLFQFRILKEAVKALINGPYTSKYPAEPHIPAERFRGKPHFYEDDCIGCTACAQVCPSRAIDVFDSIEEHKRTLVHHSDHCIFCGQCEVNCPTLKGIMLSHDFDLACFDRKACEENISHELVICGECNEIVGTRKQILWIAAKLGPLAYSNPTLFLAYLGNLKLANEHSRVETVEIARTDRFNALCPKCKREVVIKESEG